MIIKVEKKENLSSHKDYWISPESRVVKRILNIIKLVCRLCNSLETGMVAATYRCCTLSCSCSTQHTLEEDGPLGLEWSSSFEWRPQRENGGLDLLQPAYVSSYVELTTGGG